MQYAATFFATPTTPEGDVAEMVLAEAERLLPPGYSIELIGRAKEFSKTVGYLVFAFLHNKPTGPQGSLEVSSARSCGMYESSSRKNRLQAFLMRQRLADELGVDLQRNFTWH